MPLHFSAKQGSFKAPVERENALPLLLLALPPPPLSNFWRRPCAICCLLCNSFLRLYFGCLYILDSIDHAHIMIVQTRLRRPKVVLSVV